MKNNKQNTVISVSFTDESLEHLSDFLISVGINKNAFLKALDTYRKELSSSTPQENPTPVWDK